MSAEKLPEGWVETQLENIVDILDSMRVPVNNSERQSRIAGKKENELYPYFGATGEVGKIDDYIFDEELVALGEDGVPFFDGHKNKAYMLYGKTWVNNHAHVIRAISGLSHNKYLCHYLNQFDYHDYVNGGTRLKLTQANMRKLPVSLAPLAEQKIIAEKLDTLLAQVDSTKARLEKIPQILKRFRQAVLGAAMNGTLMGLKESRPHPLCKQWQWPEVPSTWSVLTYSELVDSRLGKMLDKVKNIGSPIKYLGNVNVRWFSFNLENLQEILISESERSELILKYGDILICEGGEPGRCAIWTESDKTPIVFQKALHRARVREKIIPEWLVLNLKNDSNNLTLSQLFTGTTIKHLTGKALAKYPLRVPPVYEQREIVRRVEQLFAYADAIEKQVNNALARVNNLTQSILAKAFRGELTAQWRAENPDLISGENSAAALLEKIKAERAASGGKKASRKKS
ncbi:restriction endonuclease subunit S [Escherichia marmotae]|uniref:restriction endonuclease subunit S n=1 Tax=Escherichia TaxID=561 RepID=UPI0002A32F18|nr:MULTISPECIES: restriction endonuclease subunit S [Escherichia]EFG0981826.1 restriction endonuclease subunit S [Escherichia coli]EFG1112585.1 restriction endonuclease subunit S [Escherichia coli]EGE0248219.1 restriction endonuclease subunit S [Escherichia coli]ELC14631.1 hypothetical protein WCO_03957 [Escherichia sp. KTE11]EOV91533.1 hypothetical protein A1WG_02432 [Escherichia sp. KTE96]